MEFVNTFWALVPPIVAIVLALITKETYSSLFIGILVGALFVSGFSPVGTLDAMITEGFTPAISDNAGIFMFLVILGIMVALVNSTGAAAAFGKWAARHVKSRAGTLFATFVLGVLIFIQAIPFNFYSLLTFVFVIGMIVMGFDYGPMAKSELEALKGNLGSLGNDEEVESTKATLWDMLIPIIVLIIMCIIGLMYVGGFWDPESGVAGDFVGAFGNTDAFVGLPWGSLVALVFTIIYLICRGITSFKDAMACAVKGFNAMVPAILILTFAVSLKNMTGLLGAATYVEGVMKAASAGLFSMLPAIIFIVACLLAFATGTSWGTFGILIPIVLPIFKVGDPLLMIGISACLAGAVCGDHCSPISDTTIMASAGANCNHIEHVQTQLPYAVTVALISFVNFIIAGFVKNAWICLPIGVVMTIVVLFILRSTIGKRTNVAAEK